MANYSSSSLSRCNISTSNGTLGDCAVVASGGGLSSPLGIAVNSNKAYLYALNHANTIQICQIAPGTGALTCVNFAATGLTGNVQGITINPSASYLYVAEHTNRIVYKCPITGAGATVGTCVNSGATMATGPEQLSINPLGTIVYVVTATTTYQCPVTNSPAAGDLGACTDTGAGSSGNYPSAARGVAITADGFYAYISGTDSISGCTIQGNGSFAGCTRLSVSNSIIGIGADIDVNTAGTLAYVATDKTGSSASYVALCNVANGIVSSCSSTGTGANNSAAGSSHGIGLLQ